MSERRFKGQISDILTEQLPDAGDGAMGRWLAPTTESKIEQIPVDEIRDRVWRGEVDTTEPTYRALKASIRASGVLQPLLLRPHPDGGYEVVSGARRLQAARQTLQSTVPAVVRELDDVQALVGGSWDAVVRSGLTPREGRELVARLVAAGMESGQATALVGTAPVREAAEGEEEAALDVEAVTTTEPVEVEGSVAVEEPAAELAVETVEAEVVEIEAEPEPEAAVEIEAEPEAAVEVEAEPEAAVEVEAEPEPEAAIEVEAEPEAAVEVEAEPEAAAAVEVEAEPEPEAAVEVEAEPEPEAAVEVEAEPEPEPVSDEEPVTVTVEAVTTEGIAPHVIPIKLPEPALELPEEEPEPDGSLPVAAPAASVVIEISPGSRLVSDPVPAVPMDTPRTAARASTAVPPLLRRGPLFYAVLGIGLAVGAIVFILVTVVEGVGSGTTPIIAAVIVAVLGFVAAMVSLAQPRQRS
jgi:ParB-like chromosome segregation protein Spo0J